MFVLLLVDYVRLLIGVWMLKLFMYMLVVNA